MRDDSSTPEGEDATPDDAPTESTGSTGSTGSTEHSGSRWEPRDDEEPTAEHAAPAPGVEPAATAVESPARPRRRRGLLVAAGIGAAAILAGGGFGIGYAVGDSGPGGSDGSVGHHRDGRGGAGRGGDGQGRTGQIAPQMTPGSTTPGGAAPATPSAITDGLFT